MDMLAECPKPTAWRHRAQQFPIMSAVLRDGQRGLSLVGRPGRPSTRTPHPPLPLKHYYVDATTRTITRHNQLWATGQAHSPLFRFAYIRHRERRGQIRRRLGGGDGLGRQRVVGGVLIIGEDHLAPEHSWKGRIPQVIRAVHRSRVRLSQADVPEAVVRQAVHLPDRRRPVLGVQEQALA